jgi:hypothetical protein
MSHVLTKVKDFMGGLRAIYIHLLDSMNAIKTVLLFHKNAKSSESALDIVSDLSHEISQTLRRISEALLPAIHPHTENHDQNTSHAHFSSRSAMLLATQLESTIYVLGILANQLHVIQGLWDENNQFTPFKSLDKLYSAKGIPPLRMDDVKGLYHFGYTYIRSLTLYSKLLKVVYCAVADAEAIHIFKRLRKKGKFYTKLAEHFLNPTETANQVSNSSSER